METLPNGVRIREFYSPEETRDEILRRVQEGYMKRFPMENDRVRIELDDLRYDMKRGGITLDDRLKAVLTGGRLSVPLRGKVRLVDKTHNIPLDEKELTLANVPYMDDDGIFTMGGTQYVTSNQSRLKAGVYARTKDNGELEAHCFHHTVKVWTENGLIPIGKIVNQRMKVRVWSFDFKKKEFVLRPIKAWYKNKVDGLGCASFSKFASLPSLFKTFPKTLWATPKHKVFSIDGTKAEIQDASSLTFVEEQPTAAQEQVILGSLLGDAHLTPQGLYQEAHSAKQYEYMALKGRILSPFHNGLKRRMPRKFNGEACTDEKRGKNVWLSTRATAFFQTLRKQIYVDGVKTVTRGWLDRVDERGLAFWYCDDGCATRTKNQFGQTNHVSINIGTQGFSTASVEVLQRWLKERWGVESKKDRQAIYEGKDYGWYLLIGGESAERFLDLVAPYVHKTVAYKLPKRPITSKCRDCQKELTRRQKTCSKCLVTRFVADRNTHCKRLGSAKAIRSMAQSGQIPEDENPGARWDARFASIGSGLDGMEADTKPRLTLVSVPFEYQTGRGFIMEQTKTAFDIEVEGTHNYFANGALVSNCNVKPGTGVSMRLFMEPETGVFKASIDKASIKLYPVLHALGVPDDKLRAAWGDDILKRNQEAWDKNAFPKFYGKLLGRFALPDDPDDVKKEKVIARLAASQFDPEVNTRTLGKPHANLSTDLLTDASAKLLHINQGSMDEDDRDHPSNRTFHSVDDFLADRVALDAGKLGRNLLYRATYDRSLKALSPGYFTPQLEKLIVSNQLTQVVPGLNPMEIHDQHNRVIQLGEGGVSSVESVPVSCFSEDTEVFTKEGWVSWPQVSMDTQFACQIGGRLEFHKPLNVFSYDYKGKMYGIDTCFKLLVTPNHRHWIRKYRGSSSLKRVGYAQWGFEFAENTHRKPREFMVGHDPFLGNETPDVIEIGAHKFSLADFAEFLGWYVSEGSCEKWGFRVKGDCRITISQSNNANPKKVAAINKLLVGMGLKFSYTASNFVILSKPLFHWLRENCGESSFYKRLPEEVFSWPVAARTRIIQSMILGDGHQYSSGHEVYHTTSPTLLEQTVRLWIYNGFAASPRKVYSRPDKKPQHAQGHSCSMLTTKIRGVTSERRYDDNYFVRSYQGMVYCAEVPGGLLLTRRCKSHPVWSGNSRNLQAGQVGMIDPIRSSESMSIGIDQRFTVAARKGDDGHVYYPVLNRRTGKREYINPVMLHGKTLAFPKGTSLQGFRTPMPLPVVPSVPSGSAADLLTLPKSETVSDLTMPKSAAAADMLNLPSAQPMPPKRPTVVVRNGKIDQVGDDEVDYEMISPNHQFTATSNMIPMGSTIKGARFFISSKYVTQALPLTNPDRPLVENLDDETGESFSTTMGRKVGQKLSKVGGTVSAIHEKWIDIDSDDGKRTRVELKRYFPSNKKTYTHEIPTVAVGQRVAPGAMLARNNFTDRDGNLAMGKNLAVAFMPAPGGATFEDAIVVSQSAANKMTSPHMHGFDIETKNGVEAGKQKFISLFPNKYTNEQLAKFDDNGVLKPGAIVNEGDPVILAYSPRSLSSKDAAIGNLHKTLRNSYQDLSETWDKSTPGTVAHALSHRGGITVKIATNAPLEAGDKVSALQGAKGVISRIIPDDQMIQDKSGNPIDVLINPAALIGRVNPGMVFEALLGKIAAKTGKRYILPSFANESFRDYVQDELKAHGESDTEDLMDPTTGRTVPKVLTGRQMFLKLEHVSDSKVSGRGDAGVDQNDQPSKGGDEGCFVANQKIRTALGEMEIGKICDKKMAVNIFTFSEKLQEWVFRPVTDWFVRKARVENVLTIHLEEAPRDWTARAKERRRVNTCIYPTKNHWIYKFSGEKVQAAELKVGDELVSWGTMPTADQEAFLYGTLLGDASVSADAFLCKHSIKQQAFLDWKQSVLSGLGAVKGDTRSKHHKSSVLVKTGHASADDDLRAGIVWFQDDVLCSRLRKECYSGAGEKKAVTQGWISKLNGLSVAAWILDDGCVTNVSKKAGHVKLKGNVSTNSFSRLEVEMLRAWLEERYKQPFWISGEDRPYPIISFSVGACSALIEEIARWVPAAVIPGSKKFLKRKVAEIQKRTPPSPLQVTCPLTRIPLRIKAIAPYKHDKPGVEEIPVYDMTVQDTHTYCAGPVLVSNSKRVGGLQMLALLSHGVPNVIKDAHLYRGSSNPDMWRKVRTGEPIPQPKSPFIYDKFINSLKAAGINVKPDEKNNLRLLAMTDKDVDEMAPHELLNAETINQKDGSPIKGGLMDFALHGGPSGSGWSKIHLDEPMPNPVMEEPLRRILGITEKQLRGVMSGTETLNGRRGPAAIHSALESLNLDKLAEMDRETIRIGKKTRRDDAVRRLNFITGLQKAGLQPTDMMISKVPVIPPTFRPVSAVGKLMLVSDANYLYRDLMAARNAFRGNREQLPDEDLAPERLAIYDSIKAVQGLGDPINPETAAKGVKGFVRQVAGVGGPKTGLFMSKVIGHPVNAVGRGVIVPDSDLNMDEVGVPIRMAWPMFEAQTMRSMVKAGMPATEADKHIEKKDAVAFKHLQQVVDENHVMYSRDPALHRFSIMGAKPRLVSGNNIRLSPLVVKPFGADFDGDAMNMHLPLSPEAQREIRETMLPSKNLFSLRHKQVHYLPSQEFILGASGATTPRKELPVIRFRTEEEAVRAYQSRSIPLDQPIEILS